MLICSQFGERSEGTKRASSGRVRVNSCNPCKATVLTPKIRAELHRYLAVVLRDNDCPEISRALPGSLRRARRLGLRITGPFRAQSIRYRIPSPLGWAEECCAVGAPSPCH